ncbi:hypothetical protein OWR29_44295 [Actinoplanes sp. Pm04-4]|uniref:C-type cytochrome biogenesis protein CcmI n=1 Tax=Paractinoplanes pyxinae TaxID=2997416 RepID=A0ABT4BEV8_9ACTN|nr:hypothetical protein [Actinoplanes pyxinae]MCY1145064.1 hypothetical protein [Actinoplanes pyxinae]
MEQTALWTAAAVMTVAVVLVLVLARLTRRAPAAPMPAARDDEYDVQREQLLDAAFRDGRIPAVWYRQQKAALAADAEDGTPRPPG